MAEKLYLRKAVHGSASQKALISRRLPVPLAHTIHLHEYALVPVSTRIVGARVACGAYSQWRNFIASGDAATIVC